MQIKQIKEHLNQQDRKHEQTKEGLEGLDKTLKEVLQILGGSKAMGIRGIRESVSTLEKDVKDLDMSLQKSALEHDKKMSQISLDLEKKVNHIDSSLRHIKENEGKFTFSWADIRTRIVGLFLFIGSLLSIILAIKNIFFPHK